MSKVFINTCSSYSEIKLVEIFESILSKTDSINNLKPGSTVVLKANLLIRKAPESAVTTNPVFLHALAHVLLKRDLKVVIGDSPGGLFSKPFLKSVYEVCGLTDVFKDMSVELNYNTDVAVMKNPSGRKPREFAITKYIQNADYIINVPKLKTHVAMIYTGAIKNWYGTIAGERKFDYHVVAHDTDDFANMLIDIYLLNKPHLTICDAVIGMDHNGPAAGKPVAVNLVLASEDGFALDATALKIIGVDPMKVPVMKASFKRNLLCDNDADIEIVGESITDVAINYFILPDTMQNHPVDAGEPLLLAKLIESMKPRIAFNYKKCKRCKECYNACQSKAIDFHNDKPEVNHRKCIKCFCCHELCAANAVKIKQSLVLKPLLTLGLYNKRLQLSLEKLFGMLAKSRKRKPECRD
jgi:uncharacterized protein (DUF362 family)/Fe-S-cluster-containing hydrogenase component 2